MAPEQTTDDHDVLPKTELNTEEESDDDDESTSPNNSRSDATRKVTHSEIERRRREKMNRYIDEIAQLLPIDAAKKLDKLTVLRVAVDTIKHIQGTSSKSSTIGFGKQIYLNETELLELTLATINQMGTYFFLIIECQKGRICYASTSTEEVLGYKPADLCSQVIFDIISPDDTEIVKQQLLSEKKSSTDSNDESSNDSKCVTLMITKQNSLEIGNRRAFSCRVNSKSKRSTKTSTASSNDSFVAIDFVGYIKPFCLTNNTQNETKSRTERRFSNLNVLSPFDSSNAIGSNPVSCLVTMGNVSQRMKKSTQSHDNINTIDRMFLFKLNLDAQFTYFDHICFYLMGYLAQDLLGMSYKDFVHEDDRTKLMETWNQVCHDRQLIISGNYRFRTKDNTYLVLQTIFEPFINPWNDELELVVGRNRLKSTPVRSHSSISNRSDNSRSFESPSPSVMDSTELLRQLIH